MNDQKEAEEKIFIENIDKKEIIIETDLKDNMKIRNFVARIDELI